MRRVAILIFSVFASFGLQAESVEFKESNNVMIVELDQKPLQGDLSNYNIYSGSVIEALKGNFKKNIVYIRVSEELAKILNKTGWERSSFTYIVGFDESSEFKGSELIEGRFKYQELNRANIESIVASLYEGDIRKDIRSQIGEITHPIKATININYSINGSRESIDVLSDDHDIEKMVASSTLINTLSRLELLGGKQVTIDLDIAKDSKEKTIYHSAKEIIESWDKEK